MLTLRDALYAAIAVLGFGMYVFFDGDLMQPLRNTDCSSTKGGLEVFTTKCPPAYQPVRYSRS